MSSEPFTLTPDHDAIMNGVMTNMARFLESQIKSKWETIQMLKKELSINPDSVLTANQLEQCRSEMKLLIKSLIDLRKDSAFLNPSSGIPVDAESVCPDCGKHKEPETFEFAIDESFKPFLSEADFDAFTNSSSFVGNVRYDRDTEDMTIILNNKEYNFCNVPARKFEAFKGATSAGSYFNREIKDQHNC